eukprot:Opistho-2@26560
MLKMAFSLGARAAIVLAVLLAASMPAFALYEDQAGLFDWHKRLVGVPFAVAFGDRHIYVATESSAVAALHSTTGDVAWWHILGESENEGIDALVHSGNAVISLSGGRRYLRRWDDATGSLNWEVLLFSLSQRDAVAGDIRRRGHSSGVAPAVVVGNKKSVAVVSGQSLQLRRVVDGSLAWTATLSQGCPSWSLAAADSEVIVAVCASSDGSSLSYAVVDASNGAMKTQGAAQLSSGVVLPSLANVAVLSANRIIVVASTGAVFSVAIGESGADVTSSGTIPTLPSSGNVILASVGGRALVTFSASEVSVIIDADGSVARRFEGRASVSSGLKIASASASKSGVSVEVIDGVASSNFRTLSKGSIVVPSVSSGAHAVVSLLFVDATASKIAAILSDGSLALFAAPTTTGERPSWLRDEGLAEITAVEFVDLPTRGGVFESLEKEFSHEHNNNVHTEHDGVGANILCLFINRIATQVSQLAFSITRLPQTIAGFATNPLSKGNADSTSAARAMTRDQFNLRRVLVVVSRRGALFGIHGDDGSVLWRALPLQLAGGGASHAAKVSLLRSAVHYPAVAAVVGAGGVFVFDPLAGTESTDVKGLSLEGGVRLVQAVTLPEVDAHNCHVIVALDSNNKVHGIPSTAEARAVVGAREGGVFLNVIDRTDCRIDGFKIDVADGGSLRASTLWTVRPCTPDASSRSPERIVAVSKSPSYIRSAAVGRVLADRAVLYKPVTPGFFGVFVGAASDATPCRHVDAPGVTFVLIDSARGEIVSRERHANAKGPLSAAVAENWVTYTSYNAKLRRTEIVAMEIYDDAAVVRNTTIKTSLLGRPEWRVQSQGYVIPAVVRTVAMTTTERGITNRQLLIALSGGQIVAVDRRFLDPRRPPT